MKKEKYSIAISIFLAIMVLVGLRPVSAFADEVQTRYCQGCQDSVALTDWVAIGGEQLQTLSLETGKHYYLNADITGAPSEGVLISGGGCIDLNGFHITAGDACVAVSCDSGTTNLMGTGSVTGTYTEASYGATIHTTNAAVVNLYGGTFKKTGNNAAVYVGKSCKVHMYDGATIDTAGTFATYPTAVFMENANGLFHMHGGEIIGGTTTGNGGSVRVSNGSFILDNGIISGGQATRGGNIAVNTSGKLTVNGGTITSGVATATYGGGNIYTNKRAVTINGGLITLGIATDSSYGGGNIGVYRAKLNINGGTISYGVANAEGCNGGGNIYVEGDIAVLKITSGTITEGQTVGSGGNIYIKDGEMSISGGTIENGVTTGAESLGGGNIYIKDTNASMTGGIISGGKTDKNGGGILVSGSFVLDDGTITSGQAARGGNIAVRDNGNLTLNGGTISSGTATATYGGGNIYTNKCIVTINDGLVTLGTAEGSSYGGGNIGVYKATLNMHGGTVSNGSAKNPSCRGGGNIYMEGSAAVFNMTAGIVTGGYISTGHGHSIYAHSGELYFSSEAKVSSKAAGTGGSMNLYLNNGILESAGSFTGGVWVEEGSASLTGGKYYSFYYHGNGGCAITGGRFRVNYSEYVPEDYRWICTVAPDAYIYTVMHKDEVPSVVLIDSVGREFYTNEPLTQFNTDTYAYMKLYDDLDLGDINGQTLWVDLNGKNLSVAGSGTLYPFDSANDTYDASACGTVLNGGTVEILRDVHAPNGKRYIAVSAETISMHRLDMKLTTVTLRTATVGISYKANYYCDDVLADKVTTYGVVLSLNDMPGADFLSEEGDVNRYTVERKVFTGGVSASSVLVTGIMKQKLEASVNAAFGEMPIYANPYISLDLNGETLCVGDTENVGKKKVDNGFSGIAYSLHDAMEALDDIYQDYDSAIRKNVDAFYAAWKDRGMDWSFDSIGKSVTSGLTVTDGMGYCPVCRETVTWTALDQMTYAAAPYGVALDGAHVYLAEDITYTGTEGNGFLIAPGTSGHTACFHLNGHSLTASRSKAIYGSAGVINVMGTGIVSGYVGGQKYGTAVQISTSSKDGTINLYSGTYRHTADSHNGSYVVAVRNYGGTINIYKDAHIDGSLTGKAIMTGTSSMSDSTISVYNATVDGNIYLTGSTNNTTKLVLENAKVNGMVDVNSVNTVILRGAPSVKLLDIEKTTLITMDNLRNGADIAVRATGCFTETNTYAEDYAKYFRVANSGDKIVAANNTLQCRVNYSSVLELDENNMGYCLVCRETVQWEALEESDTQVQFINDQHLYLPESLTYDGNDASFISAPANENQTGCLHLNGYDITATQSNAISTSCGMLNVMGRGTVTGYADSADLGAAVTVDSDATNAVINLYSGTYKKYAGSSKLSGAVACGSAGGTLNLYADATIDCDGDCAVYVGACEKANTNLVVQDTIVQGSVIVTAPVGEYRSLVLVDSATIEGALQVGPNTEVTLTGRPKISNMIVAEQTCVALKNILTGTEVFVSAEGSFTEENDNARLWLDYFKAADEKKCIVVHGKSMICMDKQTLPNGNKVLVIGNSMTYYGKFVIDKGHVLPLTTRVNDKGYFYQVCQANGVDVSVTNFTFGAHTLEDFYSGKCSANRGHYGHNHLIDLTDRNYDYVIFQEGSEAAENENIMKECQRLMDIFLEENPNTKFVFIVHSTVHSEENSWRSSIKELEDNGIIVVDWGAIVNDLINGTTEVPGATQSFSKFSFIVNKSAKDGRHPNILAGYLAAQMTYCAITGESAVGKDYSFWNDTTANSAFKLSSYKSTFYSYDKTVPSNTNFEAIFASSADMIGLQKLIDQYLLEKTYRNY